MQLEKRQMEEVRPNLALLLDATTSYRLSRIHNQHEAFAYSFFMSSTIDAVNSSETIPKAIFAVMEVWLQNKKYEDTFSYKPQKINDMVKLDCLDAIRSMKRFIGTGIATDESYMDIALSVALRD